MSSGNLLSICSSRGYPERLKNMLASWLKTRTEGFSKMIVHVWENDPKIEEYKKIAEEFNSDIKIIFGKKWFMTEVLNYYSQKEDFDYYQNINDDHFYIKEGWDVLMTQPIKNNNGFGISYTKGKENKHNPNAEIISGKVVKALGYYYYPKFRQFGIEPFIESLGDEVGFFFFPETIHHHCINVGYGEKDKNWEFIYKEDYQNGVDALTEWHKNRNKEIEKIRRVR